MTVDATFALVTATGVRITDGTLVCPALRVLVDEIRGQRLALRQRDGEPRGVLRLGLHGFVDGHVLLAREDPLDAVELSVLTRRRPARRVDAGVLHGRDRAGRNAVVGVVDAGEPIVAQRGDRLLHLRLRV